jgi:hypothetical protein
MATRIVSWVVCLRCASETGIRPEFPDAFSKPLKWFLLLEAPLIPDLKVGVNETRSSPPERRVNETRS